MQGTLLPVFVGFYAAEQAADLGLIGLNLWHARRSRGVPAELEGLVSPEAAERARAYAIASGEVSLCRSAALGIVTAGLLLTGALGDLDAWLGRTLGAPDAPWHFVAFLGVVAAIVRIADLPFAAWATFGVDRSFGLSAATPRSFILARLKEAAVSAALGVPFLLVVHAVMTMGGDAWWLLLFGVIAAVQVTAAWAWPALVEPLLAPQGPLPPGELRDRLSALARAAGVAPEAIVVVRTEGRGGPPNARLGGLWRPRLLLDDALLTRLSPEALEAVVAHELGHHLRRHLAWRLAATLLGTLTMLGLLAVARDLAPLHHAFGFAQPSPHGSLVLASILGGACAFWLAPLHAWLHRRQELQADAVALRLTGRSEPLAAALLDLAEDRLVNPAPHPVYAAWRLTHPPLLERLLHLAGEEG